jgi:hypothetical protein
MYDTAGGRGMNPENPQVDDWSMGAYLDRRGELDIETDDGQQLSGKGVEQRLLENWNLDIEEHRRGSDLSRDIEN